MLTKSSAHQTSSTKLRVLIPTHGREPRYPDTQDLAENRGFLACKAGRVHQGGRPEAPSPTPSKCPAPRWEVINKWRGVTTPPVQLASAPLHQAAALPRGPPYCHTGPATWPVISGQGEGEVKPDWGCVWRVILLRCLFVGLHRPSLPSETFDSGTPPRTSREDHLCVSMVLFGFDQASLKF